MLTFDLQEEQINIDLEPVDEWGLKVTSILEAMSQEERLIYQSALENPNYSFISSGKYSVV